jgi:hypothetical protein
MRIPMIAVAAAILFLPATKPVFACEGQPSAQAASTELAAETKKPAKKKVKKEKVEYMRAAPMK